MNYPESKDCLKNNFKHLKTHNYKEQRFFKHIHTTKSVFESLSKKALRNLTYVNKFGNAFLVNL